MATDTAFERLIEVKLRDIETRAKDLEELNRVSVAVENALIERALTQVREDNKRVVTRLKSVPLPSPQASLKEILIGITASALALGILTAYSVAKPVPSCPPMVNKGTISNPLYDTNWRVLECDDDRPALDRLIKPLYGIYR